MDVYYNASLSEHFTLEDLKEHDAPLIEFIKKLIPCDYEYLNRCDSNRGKHNLFNQSFKMINNARLHFRN